MIRRVTTRLFAAGIAALSTVALVWTVHAYGVEVGDWGTAIWKVSQFYTYLAALIIAISFLILSFEVPPRQHAFIVGNALILMTIMVSVYIILQGVIDFRSAGPRMKIEHWITPALVVAYWIACTPARHMRLRDPVYWLIMPLIYIIYAMIRWHFTKEYPYAIADVDKHGYNFVLKFVLATGVAAILAGYAIVLIDRRILPKRRMVLNALTAKTGKIAAAPETALE